MSLDRYWLFKASQGEALQLKNLWKLLGVFLTNLTKKYHPLSRSTSLFPPPPALEAVRSSCAFHTRIPQHSLSGFRRFKKEGCGRSMGFGLEMKDCA
jgi:hypothetical protein